MPELPKSKLSRIGFGGASLSGEGGGYGFGTLSEKDAEGLIRDAVERGINLFDTAPIYGFGLSEERLGKYLPSEAFVVTKGGVHWHPSRRVNMTNDPVVMEEMLLASLKRLRRDCIDLYMIHWPDSQIDIRRPLEVLRKYQERGVIKHVGLCNSTSEDLAKAVQVVSIEALQSEVNLFQDKLADLETGERFTMGWGTFDKGILSGRVHGKRTFDKDDCRSWAPWWNKKEVSTKVEKVQKFQALLDHHGIAVKNFALQFALSHKGVHTSLVGVKNRDDLDEVLALSRKTIAPTLLRELIQAWEKEE